MPTCRVKTCYKRSNLNDAGYCPLQVSDDVAENPNAEDVLCGKCKTAVEDTVDTEGMCCSLCASWFHLACLDDLTQELYTAIASDTSCKTLKWYCSVCVEIIDQFTAKHSSTKTNRDTVCPQYRKSLCPHGISGKTLVQGKSCEFAHPKPCRKFVRFGMDQQYGCSKQNCDFFHPALCETSVKFRKCLKDDCTFTHLKGTMRRNAKQKFQMHGKFQYQQQGKKGGKAKKQQGSWQNQRQKGNQSKNAHDLIKIIPSPIF